MNEKKVNQILRNQSTIIVTLASLYSDEKDDVKILEQLRKRNQEMLSLFNTKTKPTMAERTHSSFSENQEKAIAFGDNTNPWKED